MERKDLVNRLAKKSGADSQSAPKYEVPMIRLNGAEGIFIMTTKKDGEWVKTELDLGESSLDLVVVKNRKRLEDYSGGYSSTEYSGNRDKVTLFNNSDGKYKVVATGTAPELREKFPTIKTHEQLYCIYEGEVVKLTVQGASSSNFYAYKDELKTDDVHIFEFVTNITIGSANNPKKRNSKYYMMQFARGEEADMETVDRFYDEISTATDRIDKFNNNRAEGEVAAAGRPIENDSSQEDFDKIGKTDDDEIPF